MGKDTVYFLNVKREVKCILQPMGCGFTYGSLTLAGNPLPIEGSTIAKNRPAEFLYEGSNHLGNVLVVFTDKRIAQCSSGVAYKYHADLLQAQHYSAFGAPMPGLRWYANSTDQYKFGFNGQEGDDEIIGDGDHYAFKYRIYDVRLGRFLSLDPLSKQFPWNSPYCYAENKTMENKELEGAETVNATHYLQSGYPGRVIVLTPVNSAGTLNFNVFNSVNGVITPMGNVSKAASTTFTLRPEYEITRGHERGSSQYWDVKSNWFHSENGGTGKYDEHRPIMWETTVPNSRVVTPIIQANNIKDPTWVTVFGGGPPTPARIAAQAAVVGAAMNATQINAMATIGDSRNSASTVTSNIANVPSSIGNVSINYNTNTATTASVTNVNNFTLTLVGNPADNAVMLGIRANLTAMFPTWTINIVPNAAIPVNTVEERFSHDEIVTGNRTTTNTTTATDPRGNNIPPGN